jgi:hypothetical protein
MLHVTVPNLPETLTYSVLGSIAIEALLAILLAVRGDWLGVVLVLALAAVLYWFICRQLVAVISARFVAGAGALLMLVAASTDLASGRPYFGILFILGALALGFVFVLLQQGGVLAELSVGGVAAVGTPSRAAHLRMLEELRDAGLLTEDEFVAKRALLAL